VQPKRSDGWLRRGGELGADVPVTPLIRRSVHGLDRADVDLGEDRDRPCISRARIGLADDGDMRPRRTLSCMAQPGDEIAPSPVRPWRCRPLPSASVPPSARVSGVLPGRKRRWVDARSWVALGWRVRKGRWVTKIAQASLATGRHQTLCTQAGPSPRASIHSSVRARTAASEAERLGGILSSSARHQIEGRWFSR
jgi:hypothetical protein